MGDPEKYFKMGADAMQGKIVAWLGINGHMGLASKILALPSPIFSELEEFVIGETIEK